MKKVFHLILGIIFLISNLNAQMPQQFSYQGFLNDESGTPINGVLSITFAIYQDEIGGTAVWTEVQDVNVVNGFINVYLGSVTPLDFDFSREYWLEVKVEDNSPFPRTMFASVPHAHFALESNIANRADSSNYSGQADFATLADEAQTVPDGSVTQAKLASDVQALPWGAAGGDLTGEYPNPQIRDGAITQSMLSSSITIEPSGRASGDLTGFYPAPLIAEAVITGNKIAHWTISPIKFATLSRDSLKPLIAMGYNSATYTYLTSDGIADGTIMDWDINNSASITGTKITPEFGEQVLTVGSEDNQIALNNEDGSVTANSFVGALSGLAERAMSIESGTFGDLIYQLEGSSSTFIPIGQHGHYLKVLDGRPQWDSLKFEDIPSGLNNNDLVVLGTLSPWSSSFSGRVVANVFESDESITDAIDLSTNEVDGVLLKLSLPDVVAYTDESNTFSEENLYLDNQIIRAVLLVDNDLGAFDETSGALVVRGGMAVGKNIIVGTDVQIKGNLELRNGLKVNQITDDIKGLDLSDSTLVTEKAIVEFIDSETDADSTFLHNQIITNSNDIKSVNDSLFVHRTELDIHTGAIATNATGITTNATNITANANEITKLQDSTAAHRTEIETNADNISTNTSEITKLQDTASVHRLELDSLKNDVATNESNISTNQSNISTNTSNISTNQTNINTNSTDITSLQDSITNHRADIESNTSKISTNTATANNNASNIAKLEDSVAVHRTELDTHSGAISTNSTGIATNATNITANTNDILKLKDSTTAHRTDIETNAGDIATNTTNIATNTGNITTNANNITTNATDITKLQDTASVHRLELDSLNDDVSTNTTNISTNASNISTNQMNINTNSNNISSLQDSITNHRADIDSNTSKIGTNTTTANSNAANIAKLEDSVAVHRTELDTHTGAIATNTTGVATNATNISTNTTNIFTNQSNISTNASNISTNQANITTNAINITVNAANINKNIDSLSVHRNHIDANASSISTNTTNIADNSTKLSATPGTVEANKAVIVDGNKDIAGFNDLSIDGDVRINSTTTASPSFTAGALLVNGGVGIQENLIVFGQSGLYGSVLLSNGTSINEFSIDGTFAGNSDDAVPTEKAIKTFFDNNSVNAINDLSDARTDASSMFLGDGSGANDISAGNGYSVGLGINALNANTTGGGNVAVGNGALYSNTTGSTNIAVGKNAMSNNTTAGQNIAVGNNSMQANTTGQYNIAVGHSTLYDNTTGYSNVAIGYQTLMTNTTGQENTAVGRQVLTYNTTGKSNSAFGIVAMTNNTTGTGNSAFGQGALQNNTEGFYNTAIGLYSLVNNTTGTSNNAVGYEALALMETGNHNSAVGTEALKQNTTGSSNAALGNISGRNNLGSNNTFVGYAAGYDNVNGSGNVFIGNSAGFSETGSDKLYIDNYNNSSPLIYGDFSADELVFNGSGTFTGTFGLANGTTINEFSIDGTFAGNSDDAVPTEKAIKTFVDANKGAQVINDLTDAKTDNSNIFIGSGSGTSDDGDNFNLGVGTNTLYSNISGSYNVALGRHALYNNTNAGNNVATGASALYSNTTGQNNTAYGGSALYSNVSGNFNTALGTNAGRSALGSGNVFLGNEAGYSETGSNKLYIDNSNTANPLIYGDFNSDIVTVNGSASFTNTIAMSSGTSINEFSTDGTLAGNSDDAVPTEKAIKTYVDGLVSSNAEATTAGNGLTLTGTEVQLGGTLGDNTDLNIGSNNLNLEIGIGGDFSITGPGALSGMEKAAKMNAGLSTYLFVTNDGKVGIGTASPSSLLTVNGYIELMNGTSINEFSTDGTLAGDSDDAVPTEKAVKTYIDNSSVFSTTSNVTSNSPGDIATDDFLFGSTSLDYDANSDHYNRMFFDKSKGAFRAGLSAAFDWDDSNRGSYSVAFGNQTKASGDYSAAWGGNSDATANYATVWGNSNEASGINSTAFGNNTTASGQQATALGQSTTASMNEAMAWGNSTEASSTQATAWGVSSVASGNRSTAFGSGSAASNYNSTAFGDQTISSGEHSTAWGYITTASGVAATSFGNQTNASADYSTAFGIRTTAKSYAQTTLGQFNTGVVGNSTSWVTTDRLFVIGNGTAPGSESDALVMLKNGNTTLKGTLTLTDGSNPYTLPNTDGTNEQFLQTDGSGNVTWVTIAPGGVTAVTATSPLVSTGGSTPNINMSLSSATASGYISSTDWTNFNQTYDDMQGTGSFYGGSDWDNAYDYTQSSWQIDSDSTYIYYNTENVGIGTMTPQTLLDVNGHATIRGNLVASNISNGGSAVTIADSLRTNDGIYVNGTVYIEEGIAFSGNTIDEFSTDGTLTDNSDAAVPTEKAVKTYVDANVGASAINDLSDAKTDNTSIFMGTNSGNSDDGDNVNVGIGQNTLYSNIDGSYNDAIGNAALYNNTSGGNNKAFGSSALYNNTVGQNNTAIGGSALFSNVSGNNNVALGMNAGRSALGSGNVFIGQAAGYSETGSNKLYIDNSNTTAPLIYGDFSTNIVTINGSASFTGTISLANGTSINEFSTDGTLAGNSDDAVPTEKAVKTYVDANASPFGISSGVISNSNGTYGTDDFVFGSNQIDGVNGNTDKYNRMIFDKSHGSFRAGRDTADNWTEASMALTSFGFGYNNYIEGSYTIAMGYEANVIGDYAVSIGKSSGASGEASVAIGNNSTASGDYATSLGGGYASVDYAKAWGYEARAQGNHSTAIGINVHASNFAEMVVGQYNVIVGGTSDSWVSTDPLFTIGNGTSSGARSTAFKVLKNGNTTLKGTLTMTDGSDLYTFPNTDGTSSQVLATDGSGALTWTDMVGAFNTSASVTSNSPGDYASNDFVFGSTQLDYAGGNSDHYNRFFFDKSKGAFRAGLSAGAQWDEGNRGSYSVAFGNQTTASGGYSAAWGYNSLASGDHSTAGGYDPEASGQYSIGIGYNVTASGIASISLGYSTTASANYTMAWGANSTASAEKATAWGDNSTASGTHATAWGGTSVASGQLSTAWGALTQATGQYSTAWGENTTAKSYAQTTLGRYNTDVSGNLTSWNSTDRLFVIGNGTGVGSESDAMIVLKNGNTTVGGELTIATGSGTYTLPASDGSANQVITTDGSGSLTWTDASGVDESADFDWTGSHTFTNNNATTMVGGVSDDNRAIFATNSSTISTASSTFSGTKAVVEIVASSEQSAAALQIDNLLNSSASTALQVAEGGGKTILSYGVCSTVSNLAGMGNYSVIYYTDDSDNVLEQAQLPSSGVNGQLLYIVNGRAANLTVISNRYGGVAQDEVCQLVYAGGKWIQMPH